MSINPGGANYNWNYSNPNKEGYSTQLVGTVLSIQEVQKRNYSPNGQPGAPAFWPDGNPVFNIRIALATETGQIKTLTFQPAGKAARAGQKRSIHMDLFALAGGVDMADLVGKTICIQTQEGHYGQGNPRPWDVFAVDAGPFMPNGSIPEELTVPRLLCDTAASGGQVTPPQPQPQYQQPMAQQYQPQQAYAQPAPQPAYQPQPQYQPANAYQPQQYAPQPQQAQPVQQAPQGMDPAIMQAMQAAASIGAQVTEIIPPQQGDPVGSGQVYEDEGMPF